MSETPKQSEANEIIRQGYERIITSIRDDVWMQLQEGVELGTITSQEAHEYFTEWQNTYGEEHDC